jgi:hypothetical protein
MKSYNVLRILKFPLLALLFVGLVELANAGALRIEIDQLLASHGAAHPEQDSIRRIAWTARAKWAPASWLERTLETADARGAGKIPSRPSCLLEPDDIAGTEAERLRAARLAPFAQATGETPK